MKPMELIKEHVVAGIIAAALGKLNNEITPADVIVTMNNSIPEVSDTPLGYNHVRIGFINPVANQYAGELQRALKQLTGEAVTKSWTGDAVLYHAKLDDLLGLTPEMLVAQLIKSPRASEHGYGI